MSVGKNNENVISSHLGAGWHGGGVQRLVISQYVKRRLMRQ